MSEWATEAYEKACDELTKLMREQKHISAERMALSRVCYHLSYYLELIGTPAAED